MAKRKTACITVAIMVALAAYTTTEAMLHKKVQIAAKQLQKNCVDKQQLAKMLAHAIQQRFQGQKAQQPIVKNAATKNNKK